MAQYRPTQPLVNATLRVATHYRGHLLIGVQSSGHEPRVRSHVYSDSVLINQTELAGHADLLVSSGHSFAPFQRWREREEINTNHHRSPKTNRPSEPGGPPHSVTPRYPHPLDSPSPIVCRKAFRVQRTESPKRHPAGCPAGQSTLRRGPATETAATPALTLRQQPGALTLLVGRSNALRIAGRSYSYEYMCKFEGSARRPGRRSGP